MNLPQVSQKATTRLLAAIGVVLGIALAMLIRSYFSPVPPTLTGTVDLAVPTPTVAEVVERHLKWADEQTEAGLAPQLDPIREFFVEARLGTRAFAEEALGWDSKWKFVSDYVTGGNEHRKFLEERFAARVFATEDLEKTLQYAVASYLRHLDGVDSMLLVNLQADLEAVSGSGYSETIDRSVIGVALQMAIHDALQAAETDFSGMIGRELVSFVAGEVLATASIQLATSAGILSVGATSGAVTFGAGLVIGMIVDAIVAWAYDQAFDPAGELSRQLDGTLIRLERLILAGEGDEPGLYRRLLYYAAQRGHARNAAITAVVLP